MATWEAVKFNIQNVVAETAKAVLIKIPNKAKWGGFTFWISKKLVKDGSHSYEAVFLANETFRFRIFREGKNRKILDENEIDFKTMKECFMPTKKEELEEEDVDTVETKVETTEAKEVEAVKETEVKEAVATETKETEAAKEVETEVEVFKISEKKANVLKNKLLKVASKIFKKLKINVRLWDNFLKEYFFKYVLRYIRTQNIDSDFVVNLVAAYKLGL